VNPRVVYVVLTARGIPVDVYKAKRHAVSAARECREWRVVAYAPRGKK
jgi:hypothetical protein